MTQPDNTPITADQARTIAQQEAEAAIRRFDSQLRAKIRRHLTEETTAHHSEGLGEPV